MTIDATNLKAGGYIANITGDRLNINDSNVNSNDSATIRNAGGRLNVTIGDKNTFKADVLLSGSTLPQSGGYSLVVQGMVDGNLLLDNAALNAGVLNGVIIRENNSGFTKSSDITADNFFNLVANEVAGKVDTYSLKLPTASGNNSYVASLIVNGAITYYTSLQEAISAAAQSTTNGTLTLLKDCTGELDFSNFVHNGNWISWSNFTSNGSGSGSMSGGNGLKLLHSLDGCTTVNGGGRFIVNLNGHTFTASNTIKLGDKAWVIIKNGNLTSTSNINTLIENNGGELDLQGINLDATKINGYIALNNAGSLAFEADTSVNSNSSIIKSTDGQLRIGNTENATIKADILLSGTGSGIDYYDYENLTPKFNFSGGVIDGDLFLDSSAANSGVLNNIYIGTESAFTKNPTIMFYNNGSFIASDDDGNGIFEISSSSQYTGGINNRTNNILLSGTDDNDTIENYGASVTINGGAGKDIIHNYSDSSVIINGGAGNDVIANNNDENSNNNVSISDGDGDDSIENNGGSNVTINAGEGNDTIKNTGDNFLIQYAKGDGNDLIQGFNETSTLDIGGAKYATTTSDNDLIINVIDSGKITLANAATLTDLNIIGTFTTDTTPSDEILTLGNSSKAAVTLDSTKKYADASKRSLAIKIVGNNQNNSIIGGKGNDTLDGAAGDDTLTGGKGNDIFVYNGGNDIITDYGTGSDKISVANDLTYKGFATSGDDLILGYGTDNSLTVKDGKGKAININSGVQVYSGNMILNSNKTAATLAASSDNFDAADYSALVTIDGSATNAIQITGNAYFNKISAGANGSTLDGGKGNDTLTGGNGTDIFAYTNKSGNKVIVNYGAGDKISLDSNATLTNASVNKNGDAVLIVSGNSLTVKNTSNVTLTADGKEIIYDGSVFTDSTKETATLPATFARQFDMGTFKNADSSSRSIVIKITGNAQDNSIIGGKNNDTLDGAAGNDTLSGGTGTDIFVYSAGNDFITDYETKDKISISGELVYTDYALSGDNVVLNYSGSNSLTIKDGKDKAININSVTKIYSDTAIFNSNKTATTLAASSGDFDASAYSSLVTIDGSATNAIQITGNAKANKIYAGDSGSTLNGKAGNDTLTGGNGADIFIYEKASGNDLINNYSTGDKISLGSGAEITDASTKNKVSTIKIGSNSVTIKGSDDITFALDGVETIYSGGIFTSGDTAKVYGSFNGSTIELDDNVKIADATLAKKNVTVQGGTADDSIIGGKLSDKLYGNAGSDTLNGGKGNDSLWGGEGNDEFIYKANEGNDVILDYATGDMLTILNRQGAQGTFTKATFSNNALALHINGGGTVALKNVDASTTFNINGDSYHVKGRTIAK